MTTYTIDQFIITIIDNEEAIIQNSSGLTIILGQKLVDFFISIDKSNRLLINDKELESFFLDDTKKIKNFLIENLLIRKNLTRDTYESIVIYSNNITFKKSLEFNFDSSFMDVSLKSLDKDIGINENIEINNSNSLMIIILNPFDYHYFLEINDYLSKNNVKFMFCFSYNSRYYLSNIHNKEWHNPCPKCLVANIFSSLRAKSKVNDQETFQTIIDIIYNKNIAYNISLPTNNMNIITVISNLIKYNDNSLINDFSNEILSIDLNGQIEYDQAVHWDLCNCLD